MNKTGIELESRILRFIRGGAEDFDALARAVFIFQFEHNAVYHAYCEQQGRTPATVTQWNQIPAVPTSAFKDFTMTCFPVAEAVAEFHTSGTTRARTGKHYFKTLALYDAASVPAFNAHLFPDGASMPLLSLVPEGPHSSLAHMIRVVGGKFVDRPESVEQPVCLLGTAFHFLNLFDAGWHLRLPRGSRVMETGGFKGRSREVSKRQLYELFERRLGIPATHVVNEYGMTELSTQFYDQTMRLGKPTDRKLPPPWARVLTIDPQTGAAARAGQQGLIRVWDLANLWSSVCVQTEDLGVAHADGSFEVIGRAAGAEVRGCSLSAESLSVQ